MELDKASHSATTPPPHCTFRSTSQPRRHTVALTPLRISAPGVSPTLGPGQHHYRLRRALFPSYHRTPMALQWLRRVLPPQPSTLSLSVCVWGGFRVGNFPRLPGRRVSAWSGLAGAAWPGQRKSQLKFNNICTTAPRARELAPSSPWTAHGAALATATAVSPLSTRLAPHLYPARLTMRPACGFGPPRAA